MQKRDKGKRQIEVCDICLNVTSGSNLNMKSYNFFFKDFLLSNTYFCFLFGIEYNLKKKNLTKESTLNLFTPLDHFIV